MSVPFMYVGGGLTLVLKNKSYQVLRDHINFKMIMEALPTATEDELLELVDIQKAVANFSDGSVEIRNGQVWYGGEVVHGSISKRIMEFMEKGYPFQPLVNLLDNLMKNPSMTSRNELYDFLEHEHLPVTEDGYFLAYKAVGPNYMDKYAGKYRNMVGDKPEMERSQVDDNRDRGCSKGLHAGALNYVAGYGSVDAGDHIMIVKINPADVVSVPKECNCEKLRTWKYEVVGEYEGELKKPLYAANFSDSSYGGDDDEDYEEEYDWGQIEDESEDEDYDGDSFADNYGDDEEDEEDEGTTNNGPSWLGW